MRLWPNTLAGRTIAVLSIGLLMSNLVALMILEGERDSALNRAAAVALAERIATTAAIIEAAPEDRRQGVVCTQAAPGYAPQLSSQPRLRDSGSSWPTRSLRSTLNEVLGQPAAGRLRLSNQDGDTPALRKAYRDVLERCTSAMMGAGGMMGGHAPPAMAMGGNMQSMMRSRAEEPVLQISYRLDSGGWLNIMALTPPLESLWGSRFLLAFFVMALLVVALSIWLVRRMTAPLALFSRAAERLGRDVNSPDLPEQGPREVRQAAQAFNEMQLRLRRLVGGRTQMLAAISHDLRTPITRMRLRAEFIDDAKQRDKMLGDLDQMEAMISATLAFARDENSEEPGEALDLAMLLQGICDDAHEMGDDVHYKGPGSAAFFGRPVAIKRAFSNLLDNAIKYGGCARVRLEAKAGEYRVTVDDGGAGIPESEFGRVFEPFYRLEASRNPETGGVGLGLASVRAIIRGHGGEVTLGNLDEGGLRVCVSLPVAGD